MTNEIHHSLLEPQPEHYFSIILEGIRSDFRAVSDEVFALQSSFKSFREEVRAEAFEIRKEVHAVRQELRESVHRVEGELVKVNQRIDNLDIRLDDQHRQINGIMEMVAQNTEDIYTLKEDMAEIKQRPRFA